MRNKSLAQLESELNTARNDLMYHRTMKSDALALNPSPLQKDRYGEISTYEWDVWKNVTGVPNYQVTEAEANIKRLRKRIFKHKLIHGE